MSSAYVVESFDSEGPISPELMLVSPPGMTQIARQQLPDPEPLDEWLRRVRIEETKRLVYQLVAELRADEERAAQRRSNVGAAAFAAAAAILSMLPVVAFVVGF
jgi:hypothetical protein